MTAVLRISDGTTTISLLNGGDGFFLNTWRPTVAQYKGGGTWQSSPLSSGRRLVTRQFANAVEAFDLKVVSLSAQDDVIYYTQELRRLLEKAVDYWTADWQDEPVWVEAQATCETNSRYAIIHSYSTPDDENPFNSPFLQPHGAVMDNWGLVIERGHWLSDEPSTASCIAVSGELESRFGGILYPSPLISADDAYITNNVNTITLINEIIFGTAGGLATHDMGIRFRNVEIPPAAVIRTAWVRFQAEGTDAAGVDVDISCENVGNSEAFTTYANFTGRPRTAASVNWVPGAWTAGNFYDSPSIINPVQDVIDRADWTSGNDLTIFFDDNASAGLRQAGAVDTEPIDRKAYLYLSYEDGGHPTGATRGKGPSCDGDIFAGNKQVIAQLTHIYRYDGAALLGGNMIGETDFLFFPAIPAAGDIIYFGIDDNTDPGPFSSLAFNIGTQQDGNLTIVWEYWQGAPTNAWSALTVQDNTDAAGAMTGDPFDTAGVNTVHWIPPVDAVNGDWTTTAINLITGYWVRARITVAGGVTNVTHQTDQVYSIVWGHYRVAESDLGGDIPAAINVLLENVSSGSGSLMFYSRRLITGLRSDVRGDRFSAYLNLSDRGNPTTYTVDVSGDARVTIVNRIYAPTGRAVRWNPVAGNSPMADRVETDFNTGLSPHYFGTFHLFLRVFQDGGTAGDFEVRLDFDAGLRYSTDVLTVGSLGEFEVLDFGRITLPALTTLADGEQIDTMLLDIAASNTPAAGVGDLYFYDFVFMPVDEWAGEFIYNDAIINVLLRGRFLEVDSVINPRPLIRALLKEGATGPIHSPWRTVSNGEIIHQANADQRMWTLGLHTSGTGWVARPETSHAIEVDGVRRYLASRGAR